MIMLDKLYLKKLVATYISGKQGIDTSIAAKEEN